MHGQTNDKADKAARKFTSNKIQDFIAGLQILRIPKRLFIALSYRRYRTPASKMSEPERPTLDSIPEMQRVGNQPQALKKMIQQMQMTGFHTWGFVIYRCTYTDDATWELYMDRLKQEIRASLDAEGRLELLWQYVKFTIIEDPKLEGATKNMVRSRFRKWVNEHSVERDGAGVEGAVMFNVSRFTHCLFVDKRCLDTLAAEANWIAAGSNYNIVEEEGMSSYVVCALVDVQVTPLGKGPPGYPNIEECTKLYTGWMYISLTGIVELYDIVSKDGLLQFGYSDYFRPPHVWPVNLPSSSIKA